MQESLSITRILSTVGGKIATQSRWSLSAGETDGRLKNDRLVEEDCPALPLPLFVVAFVIQILQPPFISISLLNLAATWRLSSP